MAYASQTPQSIKTGLELPWWFTFPVASIHDNFEKRVVSLPQHARWRSTQIGGVDIRILEYIPGAKPRLSAQLRLDSSQSPAQLGDNPDLEVLIQRGHLLRGQINHEQGTYLRLPLAENSTLQPLTLSCAVIQHSQENHPNGLHHDPALLYVAAGQMLTTDTEQRVISINDEHRWLPGPVQGTEVLPLHGHGTGNVMLIRWNTSVAFKPGLDPMGEELLVTQGCLSDEHGLYPAGSWIRNPVAAWQAWGAEPGTVVYYKNGHFQTPIS